MVSHPLKSLDPIMEPWSSVGLDFNFLKKFIVAIRSGKLSELKSIFDSKTLNADQKRALLTKCFNIKDFYKDGAFVVTNAISLAEKYDNKPVLEYLLQQKKLYVSLLSDRSFLGHKKPKEDAKSIDPSFPYSKS